MARSSSELVNEVGTHKVIRMPIDRKLWLQDMTKEACPAWPCHRCKQGYLTPVTDTFKVEETADSKEAHDQEFWEVEWLKERFVCILKCNRIGCGEAVVVAGHNVVTYVSDDHADYPLVTYRPDFFHPAPDMLTVPTNCPENVKEEIRESFRLFWVDLPACANRIRSAIESVLTHLGVPVTTPQGTYLSAHSRINYYSGMNPANSQLANLMLAVKWIGNAGSHTGSVKEKDIFDGFDLLEYVLNTLYPPPTLNLAALAQSINAAKGPVP